MDQGWFADVADDRLCAGISLPAGLLLGTDHPRDFVAPFREQRHEVPADHPGRTRHGDPYS